ncbi:MAG: insulinase family protein [Muribaculaceae bacterium]|nr:insulinase family protein [Muribaculaceae bacterium]
METNILTPVYHTAPNGLRMVHTRVGSTRVDLAGVIVNVGSRDEAEEYNGLAHFVEHTIFKGTRRRRSWHISNRMEAVGGELNAYTTKEETVVYTVAPAGNLPRSVDLIADLVTDSIFPQAELDKEREVVIDELNSYLDTPADAVFDDFEDLLFAGSRLGHNILGDEQSIARLSSDVCRRYLDEFYTPARMVFFYNGALDADTVFRAVERSPLGRLARPDVSVSRVVPPAVTPFDISRNIDSHQSHTVIGARIPGRASADRFAVALLTNILGGPGMNSLLNQALRERRGLVYSIDASTALYTDCGALTIYFGCDGDDVKRCRRLVDDILRRLCDEPLTARRLEMARRQFLGQMIVAAESREQSTMNMARATLLSGRAPSSAETIEAINAITADDLCRVAAYIHPAACSTLTFRSR